MREPLVAPTARMALIRGTPFTISAVLLMRATACALEYPSDSSKAAKPDTCGAAIDVPWEMAYPLSIHVDKMQFDDTWQSPGASPPGA